MKEINVILFDDFTIMDASGPVEVFRCLEAVYNIGFYSLTGGKIITKPYTGIETKPISEIKAYDVLLIPGGSGTRKLADDSNFICKIKELAEKSENVLTVCTGSALLAKTGLLDGKKATSNKLAFDWVTRQNQNVNWIKKSRWVSDGKYYSSSGVTAGIDMVLGFVSDKISKDTAEKICKGLEYVWNKEKDEDPFCI